MSVIQAKLDSLIRKKYLVYKRTDVDSTKCYSVTDRFAKKYKKILSQGELSVRIMPTKLVRFSERARKKLA